MYSTLGRCYCHGLGRRAKKKKREEGEEAARIFFEASQGNGAHAILCCGQSIIGGKMSVRMASMTGLALLTRHSTFSFTSQWKK